MHFSDKLRLLMHVFKVSNSRLARAIHVDASLVSRWKSGDRSISSHSRHIPALATFFIHLDAYPYQRAYLDRLLASLLPEPENCTETDLIHALANWLVDSDAAEWPQLPSDTTLSANPARLLDNISSWFSKTHTAPGIAEILSGKTRSAEPSGWSEQILPGTRLTAEVFYGLPGKRQAVMNLLLEILQYEAPCDLLLISEESMRWLTDDFRFTQKWARLLQQVIEKGHRITVIHIVSRRTQEISGIVEYWLPLHLSGQIASYYIPRYVEPAVSQTLFIIRNRVVFMAQSTEDVRTQGLTFTWRDPETVAHYTRIYETILHGCLPLFSVFTSQNCRLFQQDVAALNGQPGRLYHIRRQPDTCLLPPALYAQLQPLVCCQHPAFDDQSDLAAWLHARRNSCFGPPEQNRLVYDMLPLSLLESACQDGITIASDCELLVSRPLCLNFAESAAWLEQLVVTLRTQEHYQLYLYQEPADAAPLLFSLSYYENKAALFAPAGSGQPYVIALHEANSLHSLGLFLDRFIARIPDSQRNREDVIVRLESVIARLRQKQKPVSQPKGY